MFKTNPYNLYQTLSSSDNALKTIEKKDLVTHLNTITPKQQYALLLLICEHLKIQEKLDTWIDCGLKQVGNDVEIDTNNKNIDISLQNILIKFSEVCKSE